MAAGESTNETVLESVLKELEESEYILFIDFKDPQCPSKGASLYANQEFAVASYLKIPYIALAQKDIARDGIFSANLSHIEPFNDEQELFELIDQKIKTLKSGWKNRLNIKRKLNENTPVKCDYRVKIINGEKEENPSTTYYHVEVKNEHHKKIARNCYGYVTKIEKYPSGEKIYNPLKTVELKWAGFLLPNSTINCQESRELDIFFLVEVNKKQILYFSTLTDSDEYKYFIEHKGNYAIEILVISDNFRPVKKTFYIHLGENSNEIIFTDNDADLPKNGEKKAKVFNAETKPDVSIKQIPASGQPLTIIGIGRHD